MLQRQWHRYHRAFSIQGVQQLEQWLLEKEKEEEEEGEEDENQEDGNEVKAEEGVRG